MMAALLGFAFARHHVIALRIGGGALTGVLFFLAVVTLDSVGRLGLISASLLRLHRVWATTLARRAAHVIAGARSSVCR